MDRITPENYEGYCELYKTKFMSNEESDKLFLSAVKAGVIPGILFIVTVLLNLKGIFIFLSAMSFLVMPPLAIIKSSIDNQKKVKQQLASKYPNIDLTLSVDKLEHMLFEANILKYESVNGHLFRKLNIEEYRNYIECEKIRKDIIKSDMYEIFQTDLVIPDEQLEKAKVKIKTLSRIK